MNSLTASGLSGFLSGCFNLDNFLYAFLTSAIEASSETPSSSLGMKVFNGSIFLTTWKH